jgi:hypothetical protein
MRMLRLCWPNRRAPTRRLSTADFINEFGDYGRRDWARLPSGPVLVEGFDVQFRVAWRAYYKSACGLEQLVRQLRVEHSREEGGPS